MPDGGFSTSDEDRDGNLHVHHGLGYDNRRSSDTIDPFNPVPRAPPATPPPAAARAPPPTPPPACARAGGGATSTSRPTPGERPPAAARDAFREYRV